MSLTPFLRQARPLLAVAWPIAGIQLAQVALTTTDLVMMGALSIGAIAAGGLAITLYNQLRTMCVGVVTAVGNLVAGAAGRGETRSGGEQLDRRATEEVRQVARSAFLVATLVGLLGGAVLVALSWALGFFGQKPQVLELARPTMLALAPGLVPMLWLNVLRQVAVGMRRPGSLLGVTIVSVAVNAALDGGFAYGWFGFPVLGLPGIGLATTVVQLLNFLAFLSILRRDRVLAPLLSVQAWKADAGTVREIVRLGVPISLTYGSEAGITSVATLMMGSFGPVALAAHNVVNQLAYIVYQLNIGLSQGSSILVSRAVSQHNRGEAGRIARTALTVGAVAMTGVGIVYLALPTVVIRLFLERNASAAVVSVAATLLVFGVCQQYLKGAQNIGVGLLRGLGDTKSGFRMTLIGYWAVGTPAMLLCGYGLGLGAPGIWIGLCAGFGATAVLLLRRFAGDLRVPESVPSPS
ncbi:MAG TPA: MATE family efflux transporter [Pseudonocardia sp.]|jgi:MATE family multidrug resistance protein